MTDQSVTVDDLTEALGVSRSAVNGWLAQGLLIVGEAASERIARFDRDDALHVAIVTRLVERGLAVSPAALMADVVRRTIYDQDKPLLVGRLPDDAGSPPVALMAPRGWSFPQVDHELRFRGNAEGPLIIVNVADLMRRIDQKLFAKEDAE